MAMTLRLAVRSLMTRPVRSAVLCGGFGFGIAVMAALLGVGEVILEQARAPALAGGGDAVLAGRGGPLRSARFVSASVLTSPPLAGRVAAASPSLSASLYLVHGGRSVRIDARGGIPSLERLVGDPETPQVPSWTDARDDAAWAAPDPALALRAMDRFHPVPDVPERAASWAEWLYFNGRSEDGSLRFYLTFLAGARSAPGRRVAGVRLQLERAGTTRSYSHSQEVDESALLARAPDLEMGGCRVRLDGLTYRIDLDLPADGAGPGVRGTIALVATPGGSVPPLAIRGAGGWVSGYTVPVLHGAMSGSLALGSDSVSLAGGAGYHDHNWGFWSGVTWQWGQISVEGLVLVYGRVRPPADAADPERIPGFLGVFGPDGSPAFAADVSIEESGEMEGARAHRGQVETPGTGQERESELSQRPGQSPGPRPMPMPTHAPPRAITVRARGAGIDLVIEAQVQSVIRTPMRGPFFSRLSAAPADRTTRARASSQADPAAGRTTGARVSSQAESSAAAAGGRESAAAGRESEPAGGRENDASAASFYQLRTLCHVTGTLGKRAIDITAPGSAETFRGY